MARIIIIGPAYPLRGGIANFNEALCSTLKEEGDNCSIVSFTMQYPGFLFPGTTQLADGDPAPEGLDIIALINSVNPISWFKAANYIVNQKPDLVVIRYWLPFMAPCLGTIARLVKRKFPSVEIVAIADNIIPHERRMGDNSLTSYFVKACDRFVVMSNSVKEDLKKFDTSKPVVMQYHPVYDIFGEPVGKEMSRKQLGLTDDKIVLFFGFVRHYKGLDLLIHAFADDRIRNLHIKLLVAGEFYDDKKEYIELIHKLNLSNTIILHDKYIPKEEVKLYFGAADLVAQPYRDATQSGVTQIAYHFEKPMIVTRVGGLPEMVPDQVAGYVTDVDSKKIADAIVDFYTNNREATFQEGVKRFAKNFSWYEFARKVRKTA